MANILTDLSSKPTTVLILGNDQSGFTNIFSFVEYLINETKSPMINYICDNLSIQTKFSITTTLSHAHFMLCEESTFEHVFYEAARSRTNKGNNQPVKSPNTCIIDTQQKIELLDTFQCAQYEVNCIRLIKYHEFNKLTSTDLNSYDYFVLMPATDFMSLLSNAQRIYTSISSWNHKTAIQEMPFNTFMNLWKHATLSKHILVWSLFSNAAPHCVFSII
jgi:hypothetical protein